MSNLEECYIELNIITSKPIADIEAHLPVKATSVSHIGDKLYPKSHRTHHKNMLHYRMALRRPWYIDRGIMRLMKQFSPYHDAFPIVSKFASLQLAVVMYLSENTPCFNISIETLSLLAKLHICIDVDIILIE